MRVTQRLSRVSLPAALGLLFLLLVLLASVQYRWAGELGEAERTRMRAGASARADAFSRDFDREITLAFLRLQLAPESLGPRDFAAFAERYEQWRRACSHPGLVKDVLLVETGAAENPRLSRFEPTLRTFQAVDWPPALASVRERAVMMAQGPPAPGGEAAEGGAEPPRGIVPGRGRSPSDLLLIDEVPALLIPVVVLERELRREPWARVRLAAFVVVRFDLGYVRDGLLPALAERHFGGPDGLDYHLAVVRQADGRSLVWRSSTQAQGDARGDASAGMLDLRLEEAREEDFEDLERARRTASASAAGAERGGRRATGIANAVAPFGFRGALGAARPHDEHTGHWRLVATHQAGSVDAVVAAARSRNLAVGLGVLGLLGASAALVVVSAQRARRLAERQMEFIASVSHELRTPVAVICSAAENLADGLVEEASQVRRYGAVVRDEGRRLVEMVEQVLEFAGTASGRLVRRSVVVDLERLIDQSLEAFATGLRQGDFTVAKDVAPELPEVQGDPLALGRALRNLVGNALKYGADGRWLRVRATTDEGRKEVCISVEDRGKGIPAAELPRVFEPFFRGREAVDGQVRGFGLGLALVQRVAEAHGGRTSVVSLPARGSAFTIHLPVSSPHAAGEPQAEASDGVPHPAR